MSFGENLQTIRKKNHLSQEGLAELLGVSRQAVSKWELGEGYPEVDKLLLLSKKLSVSIDSLLGGEDASPASGDEKPSERIRIISLTRLKSPPPCRERFGSRYTAGTPVST